MGEEESKWNRDFQRLVDFQEKFGHTNVFSSSRPTLAKWLAKQYQHYREGNLLASRLELLNAIGIVWERISWDANYQLLVDFHRKHGHVDVPKDHYLCCWVTSQHRSWNANKLAKDLVDKLDKIGFIWKKKRELKGWELRFQELLKYKRKHGNTNVPQTRGTEHYSLAIWVMKQRQNYRKNKLDENQISTLESIGFRWRVLKNDVAATCPALKENTCSSNETNAESSEGEHKKRQQKESVGCDEEDVPVYIPKKQKKGHPGGYNDGQSRSHALLDQAADVVVAPSLQTSQRQDLIVSGIFLRRKKHRRSSATFRPFHPNFFG